MQRKYHLFDAQGKIFGRMATEIALILRGKNKVGFAPHSDSGDFVVVVNSDGLIARGNKMLGKIYHRFSGYPGGITSITLKDQIKNDSRKIIRSAVYGMLAKNKLRNKIIKRLFVYKDDKHNHKIDITH
jgi:large subunit ribosomal protein L13